MTASPRKRPLGERKSGRFLMQVLWPAFLMAIVAEGLFFSLVDPHELEYAHAVLIESRAAAYTLGFFFFWGLFTTSSALTFLLVVGSHPPIDQLED